MVRSKKKEALCLGLGTVCPRCEAATNRALYGPADREAGIFRKRKGDDGMGWPGYSKGAEDAERLLLFGMPWKLPCWKVPPLLIDGVAT